MLFEIENLLIQKLKPFECIIQKNIKRNSGKFAQKNGIIFEEKLCEYLNKNDDEMKLLINKIFEFYKLNINIYNNSLNDFKCVTNNNNLIQSIKNDKKTKSKTDIFLVNEKLNLNIPISVKMSNKGRYSITDNFCRKFYFLFRI